MADILVVDDEIGIRELLSEILGDEGHTVLLAESAQQARALRAAQPVDLVLLDIWMPDTDGVTLLREWASNGLLSMPVIMMSGHATIDTAVEATRIGAIDFLEKPITLQKLLRSVQSGLAQRRPRAPGPGYAAAAVMVEASSGAAPVGSGVVAGATGAAMPALAAASWPAQPAGLLSAGGEAVPLPGMRAPLASGEGPPQAPAVPPGSVLASAADARLLAAEDPIPSAEPYPGREPYAGREPERGATLRVQSLPLDAPLRDARDAFERVYFEYHLQREQGSMTRVAERTGLERTHLYRKLKQLGIDLSRGVWRKPPP
jgi:DNA-binding NtrC family response regulator